MTGKILTIFAFLALILLILFFNNQDIRAATSANIQSTIKISVCGNEIIEANEQCDSANLAGQTCQTRGFYGGVLSCRSDCVFNTSQCTAAPSAGGGGGGGVYIPPPSETKVVLQGKAYPLSSITILQDGKVAIIATADSQANFRAEIINITPGVWTFSVRAEDKQGRKSITFSFTASVTFGMTTTISGIFLPPTIEIDKTIVQKGETLNIMGQTAPQSEVSIFINSPQEIIKKTKAEKDGTWFYGFNTTPLEEGSHTTKAKATSPEDLLSVFSQTLAFSVGKEVGVCPRKANINGDKKVNLVDFSILLYNWGIPKNPVADLNCDGKVNLTDFSILLYYWTG